jgi:hypothetical protein
VIFEDSKTVMQNTSRIFNHRKPCLAPCCPANNDDVAARKKKGCSVDVAKSIPVPIGQTKGKRTTCVKN